MQAGTFYHINGRLVRADPYPPEKRSSGTDYFKRPLPKLPSVSPPLPHQTYSADATFTLYRGYLRNETVKVSVKNPLDIGWCNLSQSFLARVDEGPTSLAGKIVFVKVFDSLYINPDDLPVSSIFPHNQHV